MKNVIGMFDDAAQARTAEQKVSGLGRIEHLYGRESTSKLKGYGLSGGCACDRAHRPDRSDFLKTPSKEN